MIVHGFRSRGAAFDQDRGDPCDSRRSTGNENIVVGSREAVISSIRTCCEIARIPVSSQFHSPYARRGIGGDPAAIVASQDLRNSAEPPIEMRPRPTAFEAEVGANTPWAVMRAARSGVPAKSAKIGTDHDENESRSGKPPIPISALDQVKVGLVFHLTEGVNELAEKSSRCDAVFTQRSGSKVP